MRRKKLKISSEALNYFELEVQRRGFKKIGGIDEAGCGSLCGPVVAAAVILDLDNLIAGVNDSKKIGIKKRNILFKKIKESAIGWSIGIISAEEIDRINIRQATFKAMRNAVEKLNPRPDFVLVDGYSIPELAISQKAIIKGDSKSISIAAASIVAKVTRDELMDAYHSLHPRYNFRKNKGYATLEHRQALKSIGPSPLHRLSYRLSF
jgi:ribonuclease HII